MCHSRVFYSSLFPNIIFSVVLFLSLHPTRSLSGCLQPWTIGDLNQEGVSPEISKQGANFESRGYWGSGDDGCSTSICPDPPCENFVELDLWGECRVVSGCRGSESHMAVAVTTTSGSRRCCRPFLWCLSRRSCRAWQSSRSEQNLGTTTGSSRSERNQGGAIEVVPQVWPDDTVELMCGQFLLKVRSGLFYVNIILSVQGKF